MQQLKPHLYDTRVSEGSAVESKAGLNGFTLRVNSGIYFFEKHNIPNGFGFGKILCVLTLLVNP
jgi:hypothetical protein